MVHPLGEAILKAQELLGPTATVWTMTEDHKGRVFSAPRVYVGVPTDKPDSWVVDKGRLMVGTGVSFSGAISDTRKRLAAASDAPKRISKPADVELVAASL